MIVHFAARTDVGRSRSTNEDNYLVDRKLKLYVVCDGLGGHLGGETASATAVNVVREGLVAQKDVLESYAFDDGRSGRDAIIELLRDVVTLANRRIRERAAQTAELRGMGTTLALLLLAGPTAFVAHVGDSRVYRLRGHVLQQLTEDHSLATELARDRIGGAPDPKVLAALRNQVTRAVGVHETVECDVSAMPVQPGDRFILASDGLHGLVGADEIQALATAVDVGEAASLLVDRANERGGKDNITVILVQLDKQPEDLEDERRTWPLFEAVRGSSFFGALADAELAAILESCQQLALMPGDTLIHEGRPMPGFYLVAQGEAQVLKAGEHLAFLRTGDFFGEEALLGDRPSFATIIGAGFGPSSIVLLDRPLFEDLAQTSPALALKLALAVSRSLARKVQGALQEAGQARLLFRDVGALSRPLPRPNASTRVLADTEPQAQGAARVAVYAPANTVLQRPRSTERRVYPSPTQPDLASFAKAADAVAVPPPLPFAPLAPRDSEDP